MFTQGIDLVGWEIKKGYRDPLVTFFFVSFV